MPKRVALTDGADVVNVAIFPDDFTEEQWDGRTAHPLAADDPVGPGWGHDPTHPARFAPPFRDEMLDPDPDTGEVPDPGPVFANGRIYDPDDADWPPSGPPDGKGWKRPT